MDRATHMAALNRAVEAGDTAAANEIAAQLKAADGPTFGEQVSSLPERVGGHWESAYDDIVGTLTGDRPAEAVEVGGPLGAAAAGTVGELISTASPLVPDFVKEGAAEAWDYMKGTWVGEQATKMLSEGMEAYEEWKATLDPVVQKQLDDTIDYTVIAAPRIAPSPSKLRPELQKKKRKYTREGNVIAQKRRREGVEKMIRPDNLEGEGQVVEVGPLRRKKYVVEPDGREDRVISALETVDDIDPGRSYTHNVNVAGKAAHEYRKELEQTIRKNKNPAVDVDKLYQSLDDMVENMPDLDGYHTLGPNSQKLAQQYLEEVRKIVDEKGGNLRAIDLLNVRREFDKRVMRSGGKYDADVENAKLFAARHIRNTLNGELMDLIPGDDVYHQLYMQHHLLSGRDILRAKRAKEASNVFTRIYSTVSNLGHLPRTPLALYATAAAVTPIAAPAAASLAAGTTAYLTWKGLSGPARKRAVAQLLSTVDKTIALTTDDSVLAQLKADRLILLDMMQDEPDE